MTQQNETMLELVERVSSNALHQKPLFCRWCGQPLELTDGKLYPWQHLDPNQNECTRPEPAKIGEPLRFVGVRKTVMQGPKCVAVACSKTFAKRIATALNNHRINSEGV